MKAIRLFVVGTAAAGLFLSLGFAGAADDGQPQKKFQLQKGQFPGLGGGGLLSSEAVEKLKLTAEQKEKYTKIEDEFKEKQKGSREKIRDAIQSKDKDKIQEAIQGLRTDGEMLRSDYLAKVEALLTAEQKKTFADVKNDQPRRGFGGGIPGLPGGRPGSTLPVVPGKVLPNELQEKLKLTDEQKSKVGKLQKELEDKILGVLTDEQKKQYEELKKDAAQPPRRPGNNSGQGKKNDA
jgi:Spy/CpxP family protein refolding chaperone